MVGAHAGCAFDLEDDSGIINMTPIIMMPGLIQEQQHRCLPVSHYVCVLMHASSLRRESLPIYVVSHCTKAGDDDGSAPLPHTMAAFIQQ